MKKIAIVTTGAVSLGSYEAGVLYELFSIFRILAKRQREKGRRFDYEVDVLTGASAGSVNSVIYALAAVYNPEFIHYMREVWLDGLDIKRLMGKGSLSKKAIFSDAVIKELEGKLKKMAESPSLDSALPDRMSVGLTLTNLSGIPYVVSFPHLNNDRGKNYELTTFADWRNFKLLRDSKDINQITAMIESAAASGAFPFAFPACPITRPSSDYAKTALPVGDGISYNFIYVDGGVFNNEPINRAKELAQGLADEYKEKEGVDYMTDRIYLLVDPTPPEKCFEFNKDADMFAIGQRLITAVLTEAHFRDWNEAIKVNQRITWQKKFLDSLQNYFSAMEQSNLMKLNGSLYGLAKEITQFKNTPAHTEMKEKPELSESEIKDYLDKNTDTIISSLFQDKSPRLAKESLPGEAFRNFIFVMECIGALRSKIGLDIRPLFPLEDKLLAGKFWGSFGGFLSRELREHDYNVGRLTARNFVESDKDGGLGIDISSIESELEPKPVIDEELKGNIETVPLKYRILMRDKILGFSENIPGELIKKYWKLIIIFLLILWLIIFGLELVLKAAPTVGVALILIIPVVAYFAICKCLKSSLKKSLNKTLCIDKKLKN